MKELLFALSIFCSFMWGFTAFAKLFRGQHITSFHMIMWSSSVTAMITHILGMW